MSSIDGTILLASIVTILVLILVFFTNSKRKRRPPGPYGLPLVGYLPFLTDKPYLKLIELKKKYGPVYSIQLGTRNVIVLCDYASMKEAFNSNAFMGRPPGLLDFSEETERLQAFSGMPWREHRRFSLHMFRDLGFGNIRMEPHIKAEIEELLGNFQESAGKPVSATTMLSPSMSNNITSLVFGKRRSFDDPKRIMLDQLVRDFVSLNAQTGWHLFFPLLKSLFKFFNFGRYKELNEVLRKMNTFIDGEIEEHKKTFDPNYIRDFIDGYISEIEKRKNEPNTTFTDSVMGDLARSFFGAGSETVRTSMDWLLLVSATYPEVQKKVQKEISDVCGDRLPSFNDRKLMPYTQAVIAELQRWRTIVPINLLRYTLEDTEFYSYFIPKHSYVISNLWAVHHDPKLWGDDVSEFRPGRFLSEDGKKFNAPEFSIPFSTGKRSCPGKSLADTEVFMYYTATLQKFNVTLPDGSSADLEGQLKMVLQPKPYKIVFHVR